MIRFIKEVTNWKEYKACNNIYITDAGSLVGYIRDDDKYKIEMFSKPMRLWSTTRRKFRDLTDEEKNLIYISNPI